MTGRHFHALLYCLLPLLVMPFTLRAYMCAARARGAWAERLLPRPRPACAAAHAPPALFPARNFCFSQVLRSPTFWFVIIVVYIVTFGMRFAERTAGCALRSAPRRTGQCFLLGPPLPVPWTVLPRQPARGWLVPGMGVTRRASPPYLRLPPAAAGCSAPTTP